MLPNMKIDGDFIKTGYTNSKNETDLKKSFNQHEKSAVHRFTVNRSVEVPSLTDNIVETVTKKSVRNTTKKLISFNENSK